MQMVVPEHHKHHHTRGDHKFSKPRDSAGRAKLGSQSVSDKIQKMKQRAGRNKAEQLRSKSLASAALANAVERTEIYDQDRGIGSKRSAANLNQKELLDVSSESVLERKDGKWRVARRSNQQ